jgi:type IV secretion system protein VirB2
MLVVIKTGECEMLTKQMQRRLALGRRLLVPAGLIAAGPMPVFAQAAGGGLTPVTNVMTNVSSVLTGVGVVMFTIAIIWAGFKMAFQHAKWSEISNIVIGGILVGGAATIAGWLITPP